MITEVPRTRLKVAIGTAVYDQVEPQYVRSLVRTLALLRDRGHQADWDYGQSSLLHWTRSHIANQQFQDGADVLVQVDADQKWDAPDLVAAIECVGAGRADVVGFAIPTRRKVDRIFLSPQFTRVEAGEDAATPTTSKVVLPLRGFVDENVRYIQVHSVSGLTVCSRACIERLLVGVGRFHDGTPALYDFAVVDGERLGEDMYFCSRWRALGGKIHFHADATVSHVGKAVFAGDVRTMIPEGTPIEWEGVGEVAEEDDDDPDAEVLAAMAEFDRAAEGAGAR